MAIWQYTAYLIPQAAVAADGRMAELMVTPVGFDHPPLVFPIAPATLEQLVDVFLPPRRSWHEHLRTWGDEAGDAIDIWYEGDRIDSIRVRLDLRDITRERIGCLVNLARKAGCCFLEAERLGVVPADDDALLESIGASGSARFVADPRGFLERLSREAAE